MVNRGVAASRADGSGRGTRREYLMKLPDGRPLVVDEGVLFEPSSEGSTVLWLPGQCTGSYKHWERLVVAARAKMATDQGVCSVAAASVPVRQRLGGSLGKFL